MPPIDFNGLDSTVHGPVRLGVLAGLVDDDVLVGRARREAAAQEKRQRKRESSIHRVSLNFKKISNFSFNFEFQFQQALRIRRLRQNAFTRFLVEP